MLFIDEIDSLQNEALISILRQLRDGYPNRPDNFPLSVGLIGLRDVRDYKVASGGSDRMDLCLRYGKVILRIEIKVWRDGKRDPQPEGLEQLDSYLARLGLESGWLLIFNRRKKAPPIEKRLSTQIAITKNKRSITVIRA